VVLNFHLSTEKNWDVSIINYLQSIEGYTFKNMSTNKFTNLLIKFRPNDVFYTITFQYLITKYCNLFFTTRPQTMTQCKQKNIVKEDTVTRVRDITVNTPCTERQRDLTLPGKSCITGQDKSQLWRDKRTEVIRGARRVVYPWRKPSPSAAAPALEKWRSDPTRPDAS
jgi:hypothetical protein